MGSSKVPEEVELDNPDEDHLLIAFVKLRWYLFDHLRRVYGLMGWVDGRRMVCRDHLILKYYDQSSKAGIRSRRSPAQCQSAGRNKTGA